MDPQDLNPQSTAVPPVSTPTDPAPTPAPAPTPNPAPRLEPQTSTSYVPPQRTWRPTPPTGHTYYGAGTHPSAIPPQVPPPTPHSPQPYAADAAPVRTPPTPEPDPRLNWYPQSAQPRYQHMPVPPQITPPNAQPQPTKRRDKRDKRTAFWLKVASGLLALLLLYCVGSDIYAYRTGNYATLPTATDATDATDAADATAQEGNNGHAYSGPQVVIEQQSKPETDADIAQTDEDGRYTVEGVAAAVRPSIVEIYTYSDSEGNYVYGTGSGIILTQDGYIITNAHVLTDGVAFTVTTDDETVYPAEIIGSDSKTDIAVIKIDAQGLTPATMGNSDNVVLGEAVVAIGNPAGLTGSVTNGIVSGLNRLIRSDSTGFDMNCIQTNAAISPGNSGGALVNMYGQVIGITSSKYVSSSYEGLGFAITINEVLPIVEDIIEHGYVSGRVRIGITLISLEYDETKASFCDEIGADTQPRDLRGVWITEIADDCDIANTDLAPNDVIVEVEGIEVNNYDELSAAIDGMAAGETVTAACRRYDTDGTYESFEIQFKLMADTSGNF